MNRAVVIGCYSVFISLAFSSVLHIPEKFKYRLNKNETFEKTILKENTPIIQNNNHTKSDQQNNANNATDDAEVYNKTEIPDTKTEHHHQYYNKAFESIPILQKIHARITRSKDAIWATVTLTFLCVLLVLAVAQSRMWKDHYYTESQGVPLPNFNERVLFKDVMEHKISTIKKFFKKKKSKGNDVTELESLLPPSEWDKLEDIPT